MTEATKSKDSGRRNHLVIINQEYVLKSCIYKGKSHNLYMALHKDTPDQYFVIRLVKYFYIYNPLIVMQPQANQNIAQYQEEEKTLKKIQDSNYLHIIDYYIPKILKSGEVRIQADLYYFQVFERFGPSIKLCFQYCNKQFSIPTIAVIAIQMLNTLEKLHGQFIVHRNLKPKKILTQKTGVTNFKQELFLSDFKYAIKYKHKTGKYLGFNEKKYSVHQVLNKYSSTNSHLGLAPSPKDDLEALGFILIFFLKKGDMFKTNEQNAQKLKKVEEHKLKLIPEKFCKGMPVELLQYFQYVRMTNISQYPLPDYEFLRKLFRTLLAQMNINEKEVQYDWESKKFSMEQAISQQISDAPVNNGPDPKIIVTKPENKYYDAIPEVITENERGSTRKKQNNQQKLYRQLSSIQFYSDSDEEIPNTVSDKMSHLPRMQGLIKLKGIY